MRTKANLRIIKNEEKITFISVHMPVWLRWSTYGYISVNIPLLCFESCAMDENNIEKAVEEAIISFCMMAERYGKGIKKELQVLGWRIVDDNKFEYCINDTDTVLESIFRTGRQYVNPHLKLELPV